MNLPDKIVFVDIETTGSRVSYDRIIEIGILRVENNQLVDVYQTLVNPEMHVSSFIEDMTGINKLDLQIAPTFNEIKNQVLEKLIDCVFVAHNVRFDYGFIRNEFKRYEISFSAHHFCTAKLSRFLYPQYTHHNLDKIIERFGFVCDHRHRALDDAKVLWGFYQAIQNEFNEVDLRKALQKALKKPSIPSSLSVESLESLPEESGVYIFYDENDTPLYIGKSINIKERVLSHFSNDHVTSREMHICSQTHRIEHHITSGELGALLLESELIKKIQPLYNRQLRLVKQMAVLRKEKNSDGYDVLTLEYVSIDTETFSAETILYFRSIRQAKEFLQNLVREHSLCSKYVSLEKTNSACFSYKLGVCRGACVNLEKPAHYNMRLAAALSKCKIQIWPFEGAILINETSSSLNGECYIIDNWKYVGKCRYEGSSIEDFQYADNKFNLDTYKIIRRYLQSSANLRKIKTIKEKDLAHLQSKL